MFLAVAPGQRKRRGFLSFKISHGYLRSGDTEFLYHTVARSIKHDVDRFMVRVIRGDWDEGSDGVLEYWNTGVFQGAGHVAVTQVEMMFARSLRVVILIPRGYISCRWPSSLH
jgi:hypothetical protein